MYIWSIATQTQLLLRIENHNAFKIDKSDAIIESNIIYKKDDFQLFNITVSNLLPNTQYILTIDDKKYRYKTLGSNRENFKFMAGSCSKYKSEALYERPSDIAFFIHDGDLMYSDITENNVDTYGNAFRDKFSVESENGPNSKSIFEDTLIFYMYDDHDFANNNSNDQSPSHTAGTVSNKIFSPRLVMNAPILNNTFNEPAISNKLIDMNSIFIPSYQAFTHNHIRFVILDLRAEQDGKIILGDWQKAQVEMEMASSGNFDVLMIFSSVPFNGMETSSSEPDKWFHYPIERKWFSNLISKFNVKNMVMVAGDAHMLAYDDGTNTDFGGGGFPLFQCAPLSNYGSCKGGPYSMGIFTYKYYLNHLYCLFDFEFTDGKTCLHWKGMQAKQSTPVFETTLCRTSEDSWIKSGNQNAVSYSCSIALFPGWVIALIVVGSVLLASCCGFLCFRIYKRRKFSALSTINAEPQSIELKSNEPDKDNLTSTRVSLLQRKVSSRNT
eukprot:NODE_11_length_54881_cov_1.430718.p11 type:complete len:497 gc:universal NODE_11_length_54881_cov_1.430718:2418-3908(+)